MQIVIESRAPDATDVRELARRRVHFVFRRQQWRVSRATVRLSDVNGPRGGIDKRCQVTLKTDAGTVTVHALSHDWRVALDDALARAARFLARTWRRLRALRRPRASQRVPQASTSA